MTEIDINNLTSEQLADLLDKKRQEEKQEAEKRRDTYESLKADTLGKIENKVRNAADIVRELFDYVAADLPAFYDIMREYGALRSAGQRSFTLQNETFKVEVKCNKIKKFDERADIAAERLIDFLKAWISKSQQGEKDPMYQLAMTLLERNRYGDLDYKSISKLYELEAQFNDPEYTAIMQLFKESNVVEGSAVNFYFYEKTDLGVWRKLEPSFNRM